MLRRLTVACAALAALVAMWGCTLAEWQDIGADAIAAAPAAAGEALTNPTPAGIAVIVVSFLSGLIAKSAARGFGKGAAASSSATYNVIVAILRKLGIVKSNDAPVDPA
jgi:hypothetical protein